MDLPYTKINAYLAKGYIPNFDIVEGKRYTRISVPDDEPNITFEEYLKAQLHYNIMCFFDDRQIKEYNDAYDFMFNQSSNINNYMKVLQYYYRDMARTILTYENDFSEDFNLIANNIIPREDSLEDRKEIDLEAVMRDIEKLVNGRADFETNENFPQILSSIRSEDIFTKDRLENKNNLRAFTQALLFNYYGHQDKAVYLEVK